MCTLLLIAPACTQGLKPSGHDAQPMTMPLRHHSMSPETQAASEHRCSVLHHPTATRGLSSWGCGSSTPGGVLLRNPADPGWCHALALGDGRQLPGNTSAAAGRGHATTGSGTTRVTTSSPAHNSIWLPLLPQPNTHLRLMSAPPQKRRSVSAHNNKPALSMSE